MKPIPVLPAFSTLSRAGIILMAYCSAAKADIRNGPFPAFIRSRYAPCDGEPALSARKLTQMLVIRNDDIGSGTAVRLIKALNAELDSLYPEEGANHFRLDADEIADGRGAFMVAYIDDGAVGCGAVRRLDAGTAELKRMYVDPGARGRGVGLALLEALESEARRLGVRRIVLEAGDRQVEAMALYEKSGFRRIPAFGEYAGSPLSVCMEKRL